MLLALVALHMLVGGVVPLLARRIGTQAFFVAALVPAMSFAWLLTQAGTVTSGGVLGSQVAWIPTIGVSLTLRMGLVQWILALIVTGVGALVLLYCRWYFSPGPAATRCLTLLTWFAGTMLGLVSADDLIVLYVMWELTTVYSYLLIGNDFTRKANRGAALTALIVTTIGGLAMLVGIVILWVLTSTLSLSAIVAAPPTGALATVAALLMLVGALSKSALVPFHFWLPGAMAAATPVSAYLHAAAMVKAGVYLVAVLAPAFSSVPGWRLAVGLLGAVTMLIGGWRSLRQTDIKLLLAYGTVSQLGFMVLLTGMGTRSAALAGLAMTIAHALFKSALFLIIGIIDKSAGTRDLRELSGVGRRMRSLSLVMVLAAASMAGLPPMLGFVGKEAAFAALVALVSQGDGTGLSPAVAVLVLIAVVLGSVLTMAYSLRLVWGALALKPGKSETTLTMLPRTMLIAPALLTLGSLAGGLLASRLGHVLEPYAESMPLGSATTHLALWHGLGAPLAASLVAVAGGTLLFLSRERVARIQSTFPEVVPADEWYRRGVRAVERAGVETISRLQAGSLPVYLSVILTVAVLAVGTPLLLTTNWPRTIIWADSLAQVAVAVVMAAAALLAAASRGRVRAVLLVGVTGFGVSLLFQMHGAADLALTQVLVETVTLVVFVLLLRRMPRYFTNRPLAATRWWRVQLAGAVGLVVVLLALIAPSLRVAEPASSGLYTSAKEFGYGSNIVNVVLVDTRAWDTISEISVLVIAATGVSSLIFLRSRNVRHVARGSGRSRLVRGATGEDHTWLRGSRSLSPAARSLLFEVVTRIVFGVMMMVSVWLLLRGHNAPGGGFAAGLVAGMALVTRYLAAGASELEEAAPIDAGHLLGAGLLIALVSALTPALLGGTVLQSYEVSVQVLGEELHLVSSTVFDVGVYLVVVGVLLDYARSLGAGIDAQTREHRAPVPRPSSTVTAPAQEQRP